MNAIFPINDDQWNVLVGDAADHFDDATLSRGFQYFKQGRVAHLTTPVPQQIEAEVIGTEPYGVEINLDFFALSRCDCPVGVDCKHIAAALLAFAERQSRSVHELVNARSLRQAAEIAKKQARYRAADDRNSGQPFDRATPLMTDVRELGDRFVQLDVPQWHETFGRIAAPYANKVRNVDYANDVFEAIMRLKPALPEGADALFVLHVRLFQLARLTARPQAGSYASYDFVGYYTHVAIKQTMESIERDFAGPIAQAAVAPETGLLLEQTAAYIRQALAGTESGAAQSGWLDAYLGFWRCLRPVWRDASRYEEELRQLDALAGGRSGQAALALARARMLFELGDDEAAMQTVRSLQVSGDTYNRHMLALLTDLAQSEAWDRMIRWLTHIGSSMGFREESKLFAYARFWESAVRHRPDAEPLMWEAIVGLLPYSESVYADMLQSRGEWRRWMDYLLSSGADPADYRATELQPLEKEAPETLLPFYHQAVERYVNTKQRQGYKAAVKLLKRLARLYKKTKQEPLWEQFLDSFAARHSRLRALQEELRKGKLIE